MKKQVSRGIILSFFSQVIVIIVGLLYTPFVIRALGQSEYGLYQLVLSVVNFLNLMNLGLSGAYIRYYVIAKQKEDENEIANVNGMFMRIFLIITALCLFVGVILYFNIGILGNRLTVEDYSTAKKLLIILVINLAISFPNSLYVAFMSANERFVYQKVIGIIINIAIPLINVPLLYLGFGSVGVVSVTLFLTIVRLILNVWYCYAKLRMKINMRFFNAVVFRELAAYTFFIFISDVVDQLNSNVDKLLLGRILGTVSVAIYSVGYTLNHYVTTVSWIIPELYIPEANRLAIETSKDKELTGVFIKVGKFNNFLMLLILSGFFLLGRQFMHLWVGDGYETSYYASLILMLAGYIPAVQTLGVNILNAKNMHRMRSVVYIVIACVNVIISIFLIRIWGVIGTCLGTLFAILLGDGLFMNYYYHRKIGLNVFSFWREMAKWLVPVFLMTGIGYVIQLKLIIDSWLKLIVFACAYSLVYALMLFFIGLDTKQKYMVRKKSKRYLTNRVFLSQMRLFKARDTFSP